MLCNNTESCNTRGFALLFLFWLLTFSSSSYAEIVDTDTLQRKLEGLEQEIRTNQSELTAQKALLEVNSVKLYETLIRLDKHGEQSVKYSDILGTYGGRFESIQSVLSGANKQRVQDSVNVSGFWLFIATLLVFLIPMGFTAFESGQIKSTAITSAGTKNLLTWIVIFTIYFVLGFGLMYGESWSGLMGSSLIFLASPDLTSFLSGEHNSLASASPGGFLFYQLAFAMTAALIVSTTLYNHLSIATYGFVALCIGGLVYPVFGHWAWSSHLLSTNPGWLESAGFKDFAGATVIHSLAAWFALVWAWGLKVKPAILKVQISSPLSESSNPLIYSVMGVFMLWFSWVGLTAGSHLQYDPEVVLLVLKTSLAGASAGLSAVFFSVLRGNKNTLEINMLGGVLGGFVAISAACDVVVPLEAIIIGSLAGLLYPLTSAFLKRTVLKKNYQAKAAGVIATHGFCGVWGTLCVALFGSEGLLSVPDTEQLIAQLTGIIVAFEFSIVSAYLCLLLYRIFFALSGDK